MDKYQETFETWNKVASLYDKKFMNLDLYNESYDCFLDLMPKNHRRILEIGCGPGNIAKYLLSKRPDLKILGTDIAPNMIELARKNNPKAEFLVYDSREIDKMVQKFDVIVCGFVIPYLDESDVLKLMKDSSNLLDELGLLYLSFVESEDNQSGFQTGSTGDRVYFYYHKKLKMKQIFEKQSFKVLKIFDVNYMKSEARFENHTILIAQKIKH